MLKIVAVCMLALLAFSVGWLISFNVGGKVYGCPDCNVSLSCPDYPDIVVRPELTGEPDCRMVEQYRKARDIHQYWIDNPALYGKYEMSTPDWDRFWVMVYNDYLLMCGVMT